MLAPGFEEMLYRNDSLLKGCKYDVMFLGTGTIYPCTVGYNYLYGVGPMCDQNPFFGDTKTKLLSNLHNIFNCLSFI